MIALSKSITIILLSSAIFSLAAENFTKVTIEEAFISRKTSLAFKDSHSAAEFGWKIYYQGKYIHRGGQLYATLFYPASTNETFELRLVERDVFRDDLVARKNISQGARHVLNKNGDFVILKREPFFAEAKSGPDQRASGALKCSSLCKGRVSFRKQDKTDFVLLPTTPLSLFIASRKIDSLSLAAGRGKILSGADKKFHFKGRPASPSYAYVIKQKKGPILLKISDRVAGYGFNYQLHSGTKNQIFANAAKFLNSKRSSWGEAKALGRLMQQVDKPALTRFCQGLTGKQKKDLTFKNFCKSLKSK